MTEITGFYCLRCQARFEAAFEKGVATERSCPQCGSNSVRRETAISARARERAREGVKP